MQKGNSAAEKSIHLYGLILSFFFSSFKTHGVILDWNLWHVCSSNLVSLIMHWFTISLIQQLGRCSSPLIVSGTTHTSTQYLSKHVAFMHSFLLLFLSSTSDKTHHHQHPLSPPAFSPSLPLPCIRSTKRQETHGDRQKHFYHWDPTSWCLWT